MTELPQRYNHQEVEKFWQESWEKKGIYSYDSSCSREQTFVIDTPPPTVSGLLHMGHIFSYTQADFVARFERMSGKTVFYPMGFDDNGLPTERLVEKVKNIRATDMSREDFITVCKEVVVEAEDEFRALFKEIALSVDWSQEYQTISAQSRTISQMSFLDLLSHGHAYRKLQPMLWDPIDQTAIAQAEVEDKEFDSFMNYIPFGISGTSETVTIATTRPELLGACVAVFYHPDDKRYTQLKGKTAVTSLFGVRVPFLADSEVQMDKGSGLVMCCTFGDETDIHWWKTHDLPMRVVLDRYGKLRFALTNHGTEQVILFASAIDQTPVLASEHLPGEAIGVHNTVDFQKTLTLFQTLEGLKAKAARECIIERLKEEGLLEKQEPVRHAVKCAERSGAPLEILPSHQWFIKILDQKEGLKAKASTCNWYPAYMKIRLDQWVDGLNWDWCISRQRYFGVPFPVWYSKRPGEEGKILLPTKDQLPVDPLVDLPHGYTRDEVIPEKDVMDTWATSSVSPQLNSKAISSSYALDIERHRKLFPADLRPQAHEIIRSWAFYTIVKAHLHEDTIPWKNLMISGWCLAADKTKMSKSKGNVVTPMDLIVNKGSDVVRYWASTSRLGADTAYSEDVLKLGSKLTNKLWNATKFAAIHLQKLGAPLTSPKQDIESGVITSPLDRWLIATLYEVVEKATAEFKYFEYCEARIVVEEFFYKTFCDNYLELVKTRVYDEAGRQPDGQRSAVHTIAYALKTILKLFAPFIPHITEELYSHIFEDEYKQQGSIHARGTWPTLSDYVQDQEAKQAGDACIQVLDVVRKIKASHQVSIKWPIQTLSVMAEEKDNGLLGRLIDDLRYVTNTEELRLLEKQHINDPSAVMVSDDGKFAVEAVLADKADVA